VLSSLVDGTYWIKVGPGVGYQIENLVECLQVRVPSAPVVVRLREIVGVAVEFVGEEIVAVRRDRGEVSPFVGPRSYREALPVLRARRDLATRFPGSHVFANGWAGGDRVRRKLRLVVLGRSGRVSKVAVPVQPLVGIRAPWRVVLGAGGVDRTCLVTLRAVSTAGTEVPGAFPNVEAAMVVAGEQFKWKVPFGQPFRLPHGEVWIRANRRIVKGAFRTFLRKLERMHETIDVPWQNPHRYRIQILLPDGRRPMDSGISYRGLVAGRSAVRHATPVRGQFTLWSTDSEIRVRVAVAGCGRPMFTLRAGEDVVHDGERVFLIRMTADAGAK